MKKITMLCFAMMFSFVTIAQKTTLDSVEQTITETERVVDKYTDKVYEAIQGLSEALQVPAEFLYKILLKQQMINSIVYLFIMIFTVIFIILGFKMFKKVTFGDYEQVKEGMVYFVFAIIFWIMSAFLFIIDAVVMSDMFMGFLNPDYGAIREITNFIK